MKIIKTICVERGDTCDIKDTDSTCEIISKKAIEHVNNLFELTSSHTPTNVDGIIWLIENVKCFDTAKTKTKEWEDMKKEWLAYKNTIHRKINMMINWTKE